MCRDEAPAEILAVLIDKDATKTPKTRTGSVHVADTLTMDATVTEPAARDPLDALLAPRAIAILGASGRPGTPFARPLSYLVEHGFAGAVYPVNPGYDSLDGIPCYPSLDDLPGEVDLVLMLVSAAETVRQIPAVARTGARGAVVFASGFAETGPEGVALQAQLVEAAREHGIRVLGPNCQGLVSLHDHVVASFTAALELGVPEPGSIAYIGQSGAVGGSIFSLARERGLRIGTWVSTGNQADLSALEIACHVIEDQRIRVVTLYLESPAEGALFDRLSARALELGKSVLVLRSALSAAGARAASSHTGALIGPHAAFRAMCRERGVILARDVEDFIAVAHALSVLPRADGRRLAIVTTSGGAGSLAADQADAGGLVVEDLPSRTQDRLRDVVPAFGGVANPVDVTAQMFRANETDDFVTVCEQVLDEPDVDAVLIALTMVTGDLAIAMAHGLERIWARARKPVAVVWLAARQQTVEAREILRRGGWPVLDSVRTGVDVLRALATHPDPAARAETGSHAAQVAELRRLIGDLRPGVVTESAATDLLAVAGIRSPFQRLVTSAVEARAAAASVPGPLVLKIQSAAVPHKTDRGGVRLGVAPADAERVYGELVETFAADGIVDVAVQEQVPDGPELLVGVTHLEPGFPPLLTVALGGVAAELFHDSACRLLPIDEATALEMILELESAPLLTGYRGRPACDLTAAAAAVAAVGRLAAAAGERLVELEVNPLRLVDQGAGAVALDFLLRLSTGTHQAEEANR